MRWMGLSWSILAGPFQEVVADSQCGFWCNHHCIDMIFCARQLIEKTIEHDTKAFILFIDSKKAYDSVPRAAMWLMPVKYGVPYVIILSRTISS